MKQKILLVIGFAFPMYVYAILDKKWFDLCSQLFTFIILALLIERVIKSKDKAHVSIIGVMMFTVFYAICKQILGIGTVYVFTDSIMWWLVPILIVTILIIDLVKTLKNEPK